MTEGENMLEMCARAIYAAANHRVVQTTRCYGIPETREEYPLLWENGGMHHAEAYRSARAVIEALMEPTPEMLASGANEIRRFDRDREFADAGASAVFQAMLRTASKPDDKTTEKSTETTD